tara:strand:- start:175 stop:3291 length:3117 start_codon:yes stop_codon:yes gene_type:complete
MADWSRTSQTFNEKTVVFQALTWRAYDFNEQFHISCCGCDESGKSVAVTFNDFKPSYFIKVSGEKLTDQRVNEQMMFVKKIMEKKYEEAFVSIKKVDAKVLYPFTNEKTFKFFKVTFTTLKAFKWSSRMWNRERGPNGKKLGESYPLYESNIDPFIRFCHTKNINTAGWIQIDSPINDDSFSRCTYNFISSYKQVKPLLEKQAIAPFILSSFDIECDSEATRIRNKNKYDINETNENKKKLSTIFPDSGKSGDQIKIICTSLWKYGTQDYLKHAVVVGPCCDKATEADICEVVKDEKELLVCWFRFINNYDPDVMMGWNIYGFDDAYIYTRLLRYNLEHIMIDSGKLKLLDGEMKKSELVSSAYGTNFFHIMDIPGIYKVDLYVWFKKEEKLESYKLDRVSEKFLGENKIDLIPLDLFFKMNIDGDTMAECVKYCVQDTLLPIRLMQKRMIFVNLISMANITRVPIEWLITRGQQIKVFSQITYETRKAGVIVPAWEIKEGANEKFLGATVLHANKGAYFEAVSGLDFASLYPSIMIAYNLCYSTMVDKAEVEKYKAMGLTIENIKWMQKNDETEEMEEQSYYYVQNIGDKPVQGILPRILDKLWKQRKSVKKLMGQAFKNGDKTLGGIYNGTQLAIKVSMNSVYGFTGASKGFLPMKPIASSVTARGRQLIEMTKNYCEKNYECDVVYGDTDSCYVKFVARGEDGVVLKPGDPLYMPKIRELSNSCNDDCNKHLFRKPVELEFEKIMYPFFLFTKKRYAYIEWSPENVVEEGKLDAKGIHLVRRDVCAYVQDIQKTILETLFRETNIKKAVRQANDAIGKLLEGNVPVKKLQLSKTLKIGYKCSKCHVAEDRYGRCPCGTPTINLPHVQLTKKLKAQNAIDPPVPGERVPYVFVEGSGLQHERVEHPEHMNGNTPDGLYYLNHQLKVPLETLFELVLTEENGYPHGVAHLFEKGLHSNTIKFLTDKEKTNENIHKFEKRVRATKTFRKGMRVKRKTGTNTFVLGTVEEIDEENGRVLIILDETGKKSNIFPDTLSPA